MLKIAVQKSERISKGFLDLLNKCGLKDEGGHSKLFCNITELPIELYFVRGSDVLSLMETQFDLAVIGEDTFLEDQFSSKASIVKKLGFAKCRLSFADKKESSFNEKFALNGKKIATSYVNILSEILKERSIQAQIIKMNGSVETSIQLGIADAIFDIVQTGSTLMEQNLIEREKFKNIEAVLIKNNNFNSEILEKLMIRINAVLNGQSYKYLMFNLNRKLLPEILSFLPAGKSPTITDLADKEFISVQSLCTEKEVWKVSENLKKNGAEDILVTNIDLRFI